MNIEKLTTIRHDISSPYYINHEETKVICRLCQQEFNIEDINDNFYFTHFVTEHIISDKRWISFIEHLEEEGWERKEVTINDKNLNIQLDIVS